jgi:GDSL-like Lipase/Acylhydrolase family
LSRRAVIVTGLIAACVAIAIPLASIEISLLVTPAENVQTAGQSVELSAGPAVSASGPGTLQLFGQSIPTTQQFSGPIRPRLLWAEVANYNQLLTALQEPQDLGRDLRNGWTAYFIRELIIAALIAAALAGLILHLARRRWRVVLIGVMVAAVVTGALDASAIFAAAGGLQSLSHAKTLDQLVGRAPLTVYTQSGPGPTPASGIVVIGDSTAAGAGNPSMARPTTADTACRRSADSSAADIAAVNHASVVNLACTNASIEDGLFGPEYINNSVIPSQLALLGGISGVKTVIVSIGANEMHWAALMEICLATPGCDDKASAAWFSQALNSFTFDYYDLLQHLATLPGSPRVIVNEYYDPLPANPNCPGHSELTAAKSGVLTDRLNTFNTVLADGAKSFGFQAVDPSFFGHELCTSQSFVQSLGDAAPLHPNAGGELAIAIADEEALLQPPPPTPTAEVSPSPS